MPQPKRPTVLPTTPADLLTDKRAIVDTGLPMVLFIIVNALADLDTAAVVAVSLSVLLLLERAVRRKPVTNAIGGLIGTGVSVFIAVRTGTPEGFFWPQVFKNAAYAVVFAISVLVRRPLLGLMVQAMYMLPGGYLKDPPVRGAYAIASLFWVVLFTVRAVVYTVALLAGRAELLAGIVLVLGWPAFALTAFLSWRYVTAALRRAGVPHPDELRARHEAGRAAAEGSTAEGSEAADAAPGLDRDGGRGGEQATPAARELP